MEPFPCPQDGPLSGTVLIPNCSHSWHGKICIKTETDSCCAVAYKNGNAAILAPTPAFPLQERTFKAACFEAQTRQPSFRSEQQYTALYGLVYSQAV